ncbi:MAG: hypothetical protein JXQ87_05265 [Bacteroidia bacterium]
MISLILMGSAYEKDNGADEDSELRVSAITEITLPSMYREQYQLNEGLTVSVFPIPTATYLHLSSSTNTTVEIIIKGSNGVTAKLSSVSLPLDLELMQYPKGSYTIEIFKDEVVSRIEVTKLI